MYLRITISQQFEFSTHAVQIKKLAYRNSWTLDARVGRWTLDAGRWTLDSGRWTLKTLEARLWTLGIGCWILDVKTLRSLVNPFQANVLFLFNHLKISKTRGFQRFSDDMESELQLEMN